MKTLLIFLFMIFQSANANEYDAAAKAITLGFKEAHYKSMNSEKELKNFFNKKQLSSNGIAAAMDSCQATTKKTAPQLSGMQGLRYCSCIIDAYREFVGITGKQLSVCTNAARSVAQ